MRTCREVSAACGSDERAHASAARTATAHDAVKLALREATEAAWELGVQGVPTLEAGRRLYFGDDRLEEAAENTRG